MNFMMSFLQQKNSQHKLLKRNHKNLLFIIFSLLFIAANGTSAERKLNLEANELNADEINLEKYHFKAKVSSKDKTNLMSFTPSDLTWPKENDVSMLKNSAWVFKNEEYIWKPASKSQSVKIPLRQNNVTKSLNYLLAFSVRSAGIFGSPLWTQYKGNPIQNPARSAGK